MRFPHPHPPISGGSGSGTGSGTGQNPGRLPILLQSVGVLVRVWIWVRLLALRDLWGVCADLPLGRGPVWSGPDFAVDGRRRLVQRPPAGLGAAPANVGNLIQRPAQRAVVANPVGNPGCRPAPRLRRRPRRPRALRPTRPPTRPTPANPPDKMPRSTSRRRATRPISRPTVGDALPRLWRHVLRPSEVHRRLDRYKKAAQFRPAIADARFRQGFTLATMGRYDEAIKVIKAGMEINPDWPTFRFRLAELYGGDAAAKKANLDVMAKAAENAPTNGDLALLLAIHYNFDDRQAEAKPCWSGRQAGRQRRTGQGLPRQVTALATPPPSGRGAGGEGEADEIPTSCHGLLQRPALPLLPELDRQDVQLALQVAQEDLRAGRVGEMGVEGRGGRAVRGAQQGGGRPQLADSRRRACRVCRPPGGCRARGGGVAAPGPAAWPSDRPGPPARR